MNQEEYYARMFMKECLQTIDEIFEKLYEDWSEITKVWDEVYLTAYSNLTKESNTVYAKMFVGLIQDEPGTNNIKDGKWGEFEEVYVPYKVDCGYWSWAYKHYLELKDKYGKPTLWDTTK